MDKQEFISKIAYYIKMDIAKYHIKVVSPIIAQAILESAFGTSELAIKAHNYFGLKYRKNRCPTSNGVYYKVGSEQNPDGSYVSSAMEWFKFPDMHSGILGYLDFINTPTYSNLKNVTDPETYLNNIKADGYATSLDYVSNLLRVIKSYDLTKYDKEIISMSNSSLVNCTVLSPNHSGKRTHKIDRITPHCVVGQLSAESIGGCFISSSRQASCNYGIGTDGRVCLIVDEANRSWCSSSNANDQRAVTIECASDKTSPYTMNDKVYSKLIELCTDICKRNGAIKLLWFPDKSTALNYEPKTGEIVLTVHRWFANKACPGDWLFSRLGDLATRVTSNLSGETNSASTDSKSYPAPPFQVKVIVDDLNYRSEPSMSGKVNGQTGKGTFTISDVSGNWGKLKSGAGWIYLANSEYCTILSSSSASEKPPDQLTVRVTATSLNIRTGPSTDYPSVGYATKGVYTIVEVNNGWGKLKSGAGWISMKYATII